MEKFYLTTPIYYVNAKPHIGHAYSTLSADIIARYYTQKLGNNLSQHGEVFFLTGTDEHGAHIAEAAEKQGKKPKVFCDEMAPLFKQAWKNLHIEYTHFIRTTDDYHEQGATEFLALLKQNGDVYEGDYTGLYCNNCENFITAKELDKDGNCPHHKKPPQKISEKNWFFKLQQYLPRVEKAILSGRLQILPEERKQEVLGLFKQKLTDFSISRPSVKWGIPLPWDERQTMYVWVEALLNYWTALHKIPNSKFQIPNSLNQFWPPDLQIIGKDIIKFHCVYWPAMLLAYYDGDEDILPKKIFVHGFFTINGQKMSKTLGNVIDPNDVVEKYGVDGARYLIISQFPFGADGDIQEADFTQKFNADLANGIGNLVSRVTALCLKQITNWEEFWKKLDKNMECGIGNGEYEKLFENLQLYEILQIILTRIRSCDETLAKSQPWKLNKTTEQEKIISTLSSLCKEIIVCAKQLAPFLPSTKEVITEIIDVENKKILTKQIFPRK